MFDVYSYDTSHMVRKNVDDTIDSMLQSIKRGYVFTTAFGVKAVHGRRMRHTL